MRFIKSTHHPFTDTARKRAALARKQKAEREAMPPRMRRKVRVAWDGAPYPADPAYLLDFLHDLRAGQCSVDNLPFTPKPVNVRGHAICIGDQP